jgi:hypothetical protein
MFFAPDTTAFIAAVLIYRCRVQLPNVRTTATASTGCHNPSAHGTPASVLTAIHLSRSVRLRVLSKLAAATLLIWGQCRTDTTLQQYSEARQAGHSTAQDVRAA